MELPVIKNLALESKFLTLQKQCQPQELGYCDLYNTWKKKKTDKKKQSFDTDASLFRE